MEKGDMLSAMICLCADAHAGQKDKGGQPYILHPIKVMQMLETDDEELQCIALGHDLFEDTKVTAQDLLDAGMTVRIIDGIRALTKMPGETHSQYMARIKSNYDALLVKPKDLLHNSDIRRLKGLRQKDFDRMKRYQQDYVELEEAKRKFYEQAPGN